MPMPLAANLNDLMASYFGRAGQIMNITLANGVNKAGIATPAPVTDIPPDEAVSLVVTGRTWHQLTLTGPFSATVHFEVSNDDVNWFPLAPYNMSGGSTATTPDITQPGMYSFRGLFTHARINVVSYTSGTITADLRSVLG